MDLRSAAIALSFGRAALGAALLIAPEPIAKGWVGSDDASVATLARSVGVRDVALGAGGALSLLNDDDSAAMWLASAAICDLGDLVAMLIARGSLPPNGVRGTVALAGGSAMLASLAARAVRS